MADEQDRSQWQRKKDGGKTNSGLGRIASSTETTLQKDVDKQRKQPQGREEGSITVGEAAISRYGQVKKVRETEKGGKGIGAYQYQIEQFRNTGKVGWEKKAEKGNME